MRYTLLEMVQQLLSAMDSDEVNSITDTVESNQVALLLKGVYYDLATELNLPTHDGIFQLEALGDTTQPAVMDVPTTVTRIDWIKYDNKVTGDTYPDWQEVQPMAFNEFLKMTNSLREQSDTAVVDDQTVTYNGEDWVFLHNTDRFPSLYTQLGNRTLVFDALDETEDTTLQASKTMCYGALYPSFSLTDSFAPDLDPTQFSYYLNRAKVRAFAELKQVQNAEAASETRNQKVIIQKRSRRVAPTRSRVPEFPEVYRLPRYGRS